ncbi:uncharacterized protein VP01_3557g1 [Puccinia sorghi]|uniref:Uncharacterized protein n=1 Tax=Puccinia sorghi TaxID=27349 RepID=A0A0L6UM55_9BASI|nr:uncharacterized protein VP01_532g4 [Puccinia sorghi]KNZ52489.1 uncharacterized protein VP01_3557g1 [Puccinia sorghi]
MVNSVDYKSGRKQVTNFIRMHLSHSNLKRFVPDITNYDPKKLWDDIVAYFAAKTIENSVNALDRLFDTQFNKGDMKSNMNSFRSPFQRVFEVSLKFDKKSLEAAAVVFALKRLPPSYGVFQQLQFANFKDDNIEFDSFLKELETEIRRQGEAVNLITKPSKALAVTQPTPSTSSSSKTNPSGR